MKDRWGYIERSLYVSILCRLNSVLFLSLSILVAMHFHLSISPLPSPHFFLPRSKFEFRRLKVPELKHILKGKRIPYTEKRREEFVLFTTGTRLVVAGPGYSAVTQVLWLQPEFSSSLFWMITK